MSHIFEDLDIRINILCNDRDSVADMFKGIVRDRSLPLAERVTCWEDNASLLLSQGQWRSSCPSTLTQWWAEDLTRGQIVEFTDLVETMLTLDDWDDLYEITDEVLWARLEAPEHAHIKERFEQIFMLDVYSFHNDW